YENLKNTYELSDKIPRLEPNPFLYTRIKSKLEEYEKQKNKYRTYPGILQPVFISLMLIIAVLSGIKLGSLDKINSDKSLYVSHTTEYYFNDLAQENAEVLLLND
ncbi:MAG: hypothetical protein GXO50_02865, partial [Chlorobi bacterium]|nr:hypothetical protein [Chlorobiota bacterium]